MTRISSTMCTIATSDQQQRVSLVYRRSRAGVE